MKLTPKQIAEAPARSRTWRMPARQARRVLASWTEKEAVGVVQRREEEGGRTRTHKRLTIVAGTLARRKLLSPSGLDTRPMMGMVRGATFDMIMSAAWDSLERRVPTGDSRCRWTCSPGRAPSASRA